MMTTLLYTIDLILYILLALSTGYLLFFAIASKCRRPHRYPDGKRYYKFAVLYPAYKEDRVIASSVRSFLKQDYPRESYEIIVISDQMQESTNNELKQLPIRLLIADYTDSSKAKALMMAMNATDKESYDAIVIMDADNTAAPDFLIEMNKAFNAGFKAVQAHRVAKNLNTDIALLDAVSEEINNSIFRSGHVVVGLSSALIGSGMALEAGWFRQNVMLLETAGEDKELEALLLKQRLPVAYLEHVRVEDEKTQKKDTIKHQRKRWLAAQFGSLLVALPDLPGALFKGNIDYADKIIQWMLPPRIVLLAGIGFLCITVTLISPPASLKWWILLAFLILALFIAIPQKLLNGKLGKAILQVPSLAIMMIANLFKLKGVNKKFIHTRHGEH